uniref:Uncharacterized protein n=1 Tax=Cannabis sativa TaxID=3483 RepID=A0A803QSS4_CANSA
MSSSAGVLNLEEGRKRLATRKEVMKGPMAQKDTSFSCSGYEGGELKLCRPSSPELLRCGLGFPTSWTEPTKIFLQRSKTFATSRQEGPGSWSTESLEGEGDLGHHRLDDYNLSKVIVPSKARGRPSEGPAVLELCWANDPRPKGCGPLPNLGLPMPTLKLRMPSTVEGIMPRPPGTSRLVTLGRSSSSAPGHYCLKWARRRFLRKLKKAPNHDSGFPQAENTAVPRCKVLTPVTVAEEARILDSQIQLALGESARGILGVEAARRIFTGRNNKIPSWEALGISGTEHGPVVIWFNHFLGPPWVPLPRR